MRRILLSLLVVLGASRLAATPIVPASYTFNSGGPYGYWDDTGDQLTNGVLNGMTPGINLATGGAYEWVGFSFSSPSITFDFGQVVTIEDVTIDGALWVAAGVYLPGQVVVNGTSTFAITPDGIGSFTNLDRAVYGFSGSFTGSTLTLNLDRSPSAGAWMFVDEISFDGYLGEPHSNSVPDQGAMLVMVAIGIAAVVLAGTRSRQLVRAKIR